MYRVINELIEYIEENIREEVTLESICVEMNYSRSHLSRMFNKFVGTSLSNYITRRRLASAAL